MNTQATWSLRKRLNFMLFSLVLSLWGLSAVVIYVQADNESQELFDMAIVETASLLLFLSEHELLEAEASGIAGEDYTEYDEANHYLSFQLWDFEGRMRYRSANAPKTPLAPLEVAGFGWQDNAGEITRTFNLMDKSGVLRIIVAEPLSHRQEISGHFIWGLFLFSLVLLPLGYLGVHLIVGRALGPVKRYADEVNRLDAGNLKPLQPVDVPAEITPLTAALNSAIARIQASVAREKRFTADAAHELRTPLAGVKANIQLLQKVAQNHTDVERETMRDTIEGVDRCGRMINQLLALSQSDSLAAKAAVMERVDLRQIVLDVFALEQPFAQDRDVALLFDVNTSKVPNHKLESVVITGYPTALELLLRNLVNNAIAYNCPAGRLQVLIDLQPLTSQANQYAVYVSVLDDGPGIAANERDEVFKRFFRSQPTQTKGSGLGLSICVQIAELHRTRIEITDGLDGQGVGFMFCLAGEFDSD